MWDWDIGAAEYKDFVVMTLTSLLEIVDGKWDRDRDWEVYVMARQNIALSLELMKAMEVGKDES